MTVPRPTERAATADAFMALIDAIVAARTRHRHAETEAPKRRAARVLTRMMGVSA